MTISQYKNVRSSKWISTYVSVWLYRGSETVPWLSLSLKISRTVPVGLEEGTEERQPGPSPAAWVLEQRGKRYKAQSIPLSNIRAFARDAEGCRGAQLHNLGLGDHAPHQGLGPRRL